MSAAPGHEAKVDALERIADKILGASRRCDHGVAWGDAWLDKDALDGLDEKHTDITFAKAPEGWMGGDDDLLFVFTVALPSGHRLVIESTNWERVRGLADEDGEGEDDEDGEGEDDEDHRHLRVLGVIARLAVGEAAYARVYQAWVGGEKREVLLDSWRGEGAHSVLQIDAVARAEPWEVSESDGALMEGVSQEARERHRQYLQVLEEEAEEPGRADEAYAAWKAVAPDGYAWLWTPLETDTIRRLEALRNEPPPPIPLYNPPGLPSSFDPAVSWEDDRFRAIVFLEALDHYGW